MAKHARKAATKLVTRRKAFDADMAKRRDTRGFKRPGSLNLRQH